jgi:hypothetical protein
MAQNTISNHLSHFSTELENINRIYFPLADGMFLIYTFPDVGMDIQGEFKLKILFLDIKILTKHHLNLPHYSNIRKYKSFFTSYNSTLQVELYRESNPHPLQ